MIYEHIRSLAVHLARDGHASTAGPVTTIGMTLPADLHEVLCDELDELRGDDPIVRNKQLTLVFSVLNVTIEPP